MGGHVVFSPVLLGRPPDPQEAAWSRSLPSEHGLESLCGGLFNAGEFLYLRQPPFLVR